MIPVNNNFYPHTASFEGYSNIDHLHQIQTYPSEILNIQNAINTIPNPVELYNVSSEIERFNNQLSDCKNTVGYCGNISTLEQLRCLEQQLVVHKLKELKEYSSEVAHIQEAIERLPEDIGISNASRARELFNLWLANCKTEACYDEDIFTKDQVEELEQRLSNCDEALGQLWHVLPINNLPKPRTISKMKEWLRDVKNQPLLDTVTSLDLTECNIFQLPIELLYLRRLKKLKLKENFLLPKWIRNFIEMNALNITYTRQIEVPISSCEAVFTPSSSANSNPNMPS